MPKTTAEISREEALRTIVDWLAGAIRRSLAERAQPEGPPAAAEPAG